MTSIKIHYRPSQKTGAQEGKLVIRLIHRRRVRYIPTGYVIHSGEWDPRKESVIHEGNDPTRHAHLRDIAGRLSADRLRLESLISNLTQRGEFDVEEVVLGFRYRPQISDTLAVYCEKVCEELEGSGQERTARAYRSAVRSFEKFVPDRSPALTDINPGRIKAYEVFLLENGLCLNTVSFYMRQLRAIYYRAVREKVLRRQEENPFGDVFTGVHKTRPRALTERELNTLAALEMEFDNRIYELKRKKKGNKDDLHVMLKLKKALMLFLFCFHARGMSYVDMAYLKKTDVGTHTIIYKRKKTGRFLEVGITRPMREIMDFFAPEVQTGPYVFPIIDPTRGRARRQYESGLKLQNQMLGHISKMAGLNKKVTTHVSRHTWATVAKRRQVSVAVISEALGHRDAKTTEHYLASFGQSVLDKLSAEMSGVIKKRAA